MFRNRRESVEKGANPSLRDYLLVAQDTVWVEHYVRGGDGTWILRDTLPGGTVRLASCGVELKVDELYLKVFEAS